MKNFINIENRYLADAINFLAGLRYYKFTNNEGKQVYCFENTEKFNKVFDKLVELKESLSN